MKIVCPSCEANYEVPEPVVAGRRPVRCARCGNDWVPGDIPAPAPAPAAAAPAPEPVASRDPPADAPAAPVAAVEAQVAPIEPPAPAAEDDAGAAPVFDTMPPPPARAPPPARPVAVPPAAAAAAAAADTRPGLRAGVPTPAAPRPDILRAAPPPAPRQPVLAWVFSIVVILGAMGAGILFRAPVMKAWPPSTRLYAALGLYEGR